MPIKFVSESLAYFELLLKAIVARSWATHNTNHAPHICDGYLIHLADVLSRQGHIVLDTANLPGSFNGDVHARDITQARSIRVLSESLHRHQSIHSRYKA